MEATSETGESHELLWDCIRETRVAMMTTKGADGALHGRPMMTQQPISGSLRESSEDLWFFTSIDSSKAVEIEDDAQVQVSYVGKGLNRFVSISGTARVSRDRSKIRELWNDDVSAWFPNGVDDPSVALIVVTVHAADYWSGPAGPAARLFQSVRRALGEPFQVGEHAKVEIL